MQSKQLFERLKQKSSYSSYMKANPDSFLYAVFCTFSLDEKQKDSIQFDFFDEKTKKIAIAEYPFDEMKLTLQQIPKPNPLNLEHIKMDVEDIWDQMKEKQKDNQDSSNVNKIIAVLKDNHWDLTCITTTVDILRIKIDANNLSCMKFEKQNLMNMVKIKKMDKKEEEI